MSDETEPTPEEENASPERRREEDAQRGPGHEDPEKAIEPDKESAGATPPEPPDRVP